MDVSHLLSLERVQPLTRTSVASLYDRPGMPESVRRDTVGASPGRSAMDTDDSGDDEDATNAPRASVQASAYQASFNPLRAGLEGCEVHPAQLDPANYYSVEAGVFCPPFISPLHEAPLPSAQGAVDVFFVPDTPGGINLLLAELPAPPSSHSNLGEPLVSAYARVLRERPPAGMSADQVERMGKAELGRHLEAVVRGYKDEADAPGHESAGEAYRRATHCPNPRLANPEGETAAARMNVVTGRVEREDVLKGTREQGGGSTACARAPAARRGRALRGVGLRRGGGRGRGGRGRGALRADPHATPGARESDAPPGDVRDGQLPIADGQRRVREPPAAAAQRAPRAAARRLPRLQRGGWRHVRRGHVLPPHRSGLALGHRQLDLAHGRMLGIEGADAGHVLPTLLSHTFGACLDTRRRCSRCTTPSRRRADTTSALPKMVPECVVRPSGYESARGTTGDAVSDMFTLTYDEAQTQFLGDQSGKNPVAAEKQEAMKTKLSLKRVDVARPEYKESADGTRKLEEHRIETKHREAMVMTMNKTRLLGATAHTLGEQMP